MQIHTKHSLIRWCENERKYRQTDTHTHTIEPNEIDIQQCKYDDKYCHLMWRAVRRLAVVVISISSTPFSGKYSTHEKHTRSRTHTQAMLETRIGTSTKWPILTQYLGISHFDTCHTNEHIRNNVLYFYCHTAVCDLSVCRRLSSRGGTVLEATRHALIFGWYIVHMRVIHIHCVVAVDTSFSISLTLALSVCRIRPNYMVSVSVARCYFFRLHGHDGTAVILALLGALIL